MWKIEIAQVSGFQLNFHIAFIGPHFWITIRAKDKNYDKRRRHFFWRKNTQVVVLVLHLLNFLWAVVYKYIVGCRNYYQCFILRLSTILNYLNIANDFVRTVWPKREQRVVDHLPLLTYGIKLSLEAWILESKNSNLNFK